MINREVDEIHSNDNDHVNSVIFYVSIGFLMSVILHMIK
jgi:hypothetical protein